MRLFRSKKRAGTPYHGYSDPSSHGGIMPEQQGTASRTRVVRLGENIVIQWLSIHGTPMQTITLPIPEALRVAQEVQRRAGK